MRTIKFRGYNKKRGIWLYGNYILNRGAHFIAPQEFADGKTWEDYEVTLESIGQFTGLLDSNGQEIYEGDILSNGRDTVAVSYSIEFAAFVGLYSGREDLILNLDDCIDQPLDELKLKVVGNVYDNPDLLEVAHD